MTASVTSPSGVTEVCDVISLNDCHYSIKFVPKEMGVHTVSVKHKDMHIPGKHISSGFKHFIYIYIYIFLRFQIWYTVLYMYIYVDFSLYFSFLGSPFEFTVGPITGGGAHKVHAAGPGLEKGEVHSPCK